MLRSSGDRKSWAFPKDKNFIETSASRGPWNAKHNGGGSSSKHISGLSGGANFRALNANKSYSNLSKSTSALDYHMKVNSKQSQHYTPMLVASPASSHHRNSSQGTKATSDYANRKYQKCSCNCSEPKVQGGQNHYKNVQIQQQQRASSRVAANQSKLYEIARNNNNNNSSSSNGNCLMENAKSTCNCRNARSHSKSMEDIRALPNSNRHHRNSTKSSMTTAATTTSSGTTPAIAAVPIIKTNKHQFSNDESNSNYSPSRFGTPLAAIASNLNNNWKYKRHSTENLLEENGGNNNNNSNVKAFEDSFQNDSNRPHFVAVTTLEDVQAVRCAEFHPTGRVYAVGSNSKTFRICEYPSLSEVREEHTTYQPTVLFKRTKHHKGSIYCMGWAPDGELVATGSNDKTIKLMRYDDVNKQLEGREIELTMHDGTVRDLCFLEDSSNKASLLISGGAGDCKIYVTDCATATPFQALSGHGGHILSLYNWGGAMFVSGSQDKTIRFWDLRTRGCVNTVTPATAPGTRQGSPVAAVCVDPSGRLLVSGHEDSSCVLYDIRGNRPIQCFKPHSADIRSIRFSPSAYYLLTSGYDNKLVLTDLQGDLTLPLPSVVVAHHADKVISGRWHPHDFSFLSTSADKTATLWALPPL